MKSPLPSPSAAAAAATTKFRSLPKLLTSLLLFLCITYTTYTLKLLSPNTPCPDINKPIKIPPKATLRNQTLPKFPQKPHQKTEIQDIVFAIASSAKVWEKRKEYVKVWFEPGRMRGVVWMDEAVAVEEDEAGVLPPVVVSEDQGGRMGRRIARVVAETVRLGAENVRWVVMGDDDTVFVGDNLVRVLGKYDHNGFYYVGSSSESHLQNIRMSYGMAYGGGGVALSYPLAVAVERMIDGCLDSYPGLYASDDRIQACITHLGVPLTKELGFHQCDVYGNLYGLLAAHPVTPLVSLHHLDIVEPIFPDVTRLEALRRLFIPMRLDSAALMQQSICYDRAKGWTISVSWGFTVQIFRGFFELCFTVQIFRGFFSPRELEIPSRTFLNWYRKADYTAYAFNTRPVTRNPCQMPFIFYFSNATFNSSTGFTTSEYSRDRVAHPFCKWKMADPAVLHMVKVFKKPNPSLWDSAPRRNCCRVMGMEKEGSVLSVDVGTCREGEIISH